MCERPDEFIELPEGAVLFADRSGDNHVERGVIEMAVNPGCRLRQSDGRASEGSPSSPKYKATSSEFTRA